MKNQVRWGIWGTGAIAHSVVQDFKLAQGTVLHAVASRTGERAKEFAAEYGAAKWYEGLDSLLNDAEVDVVYIATPNHSHLKDCLACIHAAKAVLCEKPFALNMAEAQLISDAARMHSVFCMEAMWTRFIPAVIDAKRRVDSGEIGTVRLIQGNFCHTTARDTGSRLFDLNMGGGVLLDLGVYLVSLSQHLLGTPNFIHGTAVLGPTGVDEQSTYQLVFSDGAIADLAASLQVRGTNDFVIAGDRGSLRLCEPFYAAHRVESEVYGIQEAGQKVSVASQPSTGGFVQRLRKNSALKLMRRRLSSLLNAARGRQSKSFLFAGNGYQFQLMEVNRCIREGRTESATMPLADSLEVMKTMDALRSQWGLIYPQDSSRLQS